MYDCTECYPMNDFKEGRCFTCDDKPGYQTPSDELATECEEIKGDGYNFGQYQCDDGNRVDGDGCDGDGNIEEGYACTGGSPLSADVCIDNQKPISTIEIVNNANQIFIQFNEAVFL